MNQSELMGFAGTVSMELARQRAEILVLEGRSRDDAIANALELYRILMRGAGLPAEQADDPQIRAILERSVPRAASAPDAPLH